MRGVFGPAFLALLFRGILGLGACLANAAPSRLIPQHKIVSLPATPASDRTAGLQFGRTAATAVVRDGIGRSGTTEHGCDEVEIERASQSIPRSLSLCPPPSSRLPPLSESSPLPTDERATPSPLSVVFGLRSSTTALTARTLSDQAVQTSSRLAATLHTFSWQGQGEGGSHLYRFWPVDRWAASLVRPRVLRGGGDG